jgi:hypothetical protein
VSFFGLFAVGCGVLQHVIVSETWSKIIFGEGGWRNPAIQFNRSCLFSSELTCIKCANVYKSIKCSIKSLLANGVGCWMIMMMSINICSHWNVYLIVNDFYCNGCEDLQHFWIWVWRNLRSWIYKLIVIQQHHHTYHAHYIMEQMKISLFRQFSFKIYSTFFKFHYSRRHRSWDVCERTCNNSWIKHITANVV